jgi:hypothetical protein
MKRIILFFVVLMTGFATYSAFSQTGVEPVALGLPGDNLNLYAVLDVFKKSATLEEFERVLNDKDSNINNLDLNNDNAVDYIEIRSYKTGNFHSIVLRVAINSIEYQDVAVIEVAKNSIGNVIVQIIGDEDLYGKEYIVEPSFSETPNPGYLGNQKVIVSSGVDYYANNWPIAIQLFLPTFSLYVSPWHWGLYPIYWRPWPPVFFHFYWDFNRHYYTNNYYRRWSYVRYPVHHSYYYTRRQSSAIVRQYRDAGSYNSVYQGRVYRMPEAPERKNTVPVRQYKSPSMQRSEIRSGNPARTRPQTPLISRPQSRKESPSVSRSQSRTQTAPAVRSQSPRQVPLVKRPLIRPQVPATNRPSVNPPADRSNRVNKKN